MEKLKFFTFNNLRWQYRKFRWDEIKDRCKPQFLPRAEGYYGWLDPFADTLLADPGKCAFHLCRMIGLADEPDEDFPTAAILLTNDHFVDAEGVAWPVDTLAVIPNSSADEAFCFLVAPKPRV